MVSFIKIGIFIGVGVFLNRVVYLIYRFASRKTDSVHLHFTKSAVNVFIDVIIIYSLAQQFDITKDISKTLLQSGSLLVAIATFAAQQTLANVISGISLSVSSPYNVDEKIKVIQNGNIIAEGIVKDVTMRHTIVRQYNGESCIIPNAIMDSAVIINSNFTENVGNFLEVVISFESDVEEAIRIMSRICIENKRTLNTTENLITVKGYTQYGVVLKTTIWTKNLDDNFRACSEIRIDIIKEFKEKGIEIPYQTVTVHNKSG